MVNKANMFQSNVFQCHSVQGHAHMYYLPYIFYCNYYNKRYSFWIVNVREILCYFSVNKRNFFDIFGYVGVLYKKSNDKLHLLYKLLHL